MDPTPSYSLRDGLGYRLSRLSKLMQARLDQRLAPQGVTRIKWCVLSGVGLEGITTPSGLADHIGITRQAMSRLLLQMIGDGLIDRRLDASDGRARHIALTKLGYARLAVCLPLVLENQRHFAAKLPTAEMAQLSRLIDAMLLGEDTALDKI